MANQNNLKLRFNLLCSYFNYLKNRLTNDRIAINAGYLAYVTLLSLVPLATVLVTALSKFDAFSQVSEQLQDFIFSNFVPAAGEAVKSALDGFITNTTSMTTVGGIFVFITAMLLISNIDSNLNFIWRVTRKRRLIHSFAMYWMVLTLGPILVAASLILTSHISAEQYLGKEIVGIIYELLPVLFSMLMFCGLYLLVPLAKVKFTHALIGALVASVLFEAAKKGFAMYIIAFPSYQLIYGALAAIPILFVWVYLSWFIVLAGAEITASLGERKQWDNLNLKNSVDAKEDVAL